MKGRKERSGRRLAMIALPLAVVLAVGALAACSPTPAKDAGAGASASAPSVTLETMADSVNGYPNFLDNSAGMFEDTYYNSEMLNTGNRGCNACHTDLFSVLDTNDDGFEHILVSTGYDKNGSYSDCVPCHRINMNLTGMYMGDAIHGRHYSSESFVANNGNCWSCHAVNEGPETGEFELVLFDELYDTAALGGYAKASVVPDIRDWVAARGFKNGYLTSMGIEESPNVEVVFDQEATPSDDVFVVNNWGAEVTGKGKGENIYKIEGEGETFSFDAVCAEDNAVSITGVNNPRSFTKAELQAMPQTEFTMNLACGTNGNGGALMANIPMTGVDMAYVIEQCGGLVEGNNAVMVQGWDGWIAMGMPLDASLYTQDAYLVTKQYGQDLTADQGAPIMLASKGAAGVMQVKHIKSIDFSQADDPFLNAGDLPVNGMWFQNNGTTYKLGEPIELSAAAYAFTRQCGDIETVSFSFDMGQTWQEYNVASEISGYDPDQWARATLKWTPAEAGSYNIMMQAKTEQGVEMAKPVSLIVVVEE